MTPRCIRSQSDLEEGAAWLAAREPRFANVLPRIEPLPMRWRGDGFGALLHAILGQQISVAAADAIWRRLEGAGLTSEAAVQEAGAEVLRTHGLTRAKSDYALALAEASVDWEGLHRLGDAEAIDRLVAIKGIGLWTAEVYVCFALRRADIFAAGDLALREAARNLFEMPARPTEPQLRERAKNWAPWRSVAARILWAYYKDIKKREGIR